MRPLDKPRGRAYIFVVLFSFLLSISLFDMVNSYNPRPGGAGGRPRPFASAHSGGPATSPLRLPSLTAFCDHQTVLKTTRTRPSPGYQ